jgi:hypothetical protein
MLIYKSGWLRPGRAALYRSNQSPLWSIQVEQFIDVFEASGGQAALEGGNSYPHTVAANTIA